MFLHAERRGAGPRLVLVHGFTQTGGAGARRPTRSPPTTRWCWSTRRATAGRRRSWRTCRTGGRLIADQGGEATYLGYSMGARFCLHVALANPELVRGLVLLGGTAGIEDPAEREQRRQQDLATAARIERDGLEAFLDDWLAQPLFAGLPPERAVPDASGSRTPSTGCGRASSRPAPAPRTRRGTSSTASTCRCSCSPAPTTPSSPRSPSAWPPRSAPTPPLALIEGAGHAAHLEQPERFLAVVQPWLAAPRPLTRPGQRSWSTGRGTQHRP